MTRGDVLALVNRHPARIRSVKVILRDWLDPSGLVRNGSFIPLLVLLGGLGLSACTGTTPQVAAEGGTYPGATRLAEGGDLATFAADGRQCSSTHVTYGAQEEFINVVAFFEGQGFQGEWQGPHWRAEKGIGSLKEFARVVVSDGSTEEVQQVLPGSAWKTIFTMHRCSESAVPIRG